MDEKQRRLSRRQMLKIVAAGAGTFDLEACGGAPTAATTTVPPQPTTAPAASEPTTAPATEAAATTAPATEASGATATAATEAGGASGATGAAATSASDINVRAGKIAANIQAGQAAYGSYEVRHLSNPVELVVWAPSGEDTDPFIRSLKAGMDRFQKQYPEIKINWQPVAGNELDTKINAAIAAKQGPDIVFESDREAEYPRRGVIPPLMEELLGIDYIHNHKFYPVTPLNDGKIYWVHCSVMGPILYVNKELLAKEGLKPIDVPKTWDEFARFAKQLTKFNGSQMAQAGFAFNNYARYIWNDMMYQQGAHVYDSTKSFVNTPESEHAFQTLVDFYDKYQINDRTFLAFDEAFGTGKAATTQVWTWFGSTLEANYPDIDWAPVMYPTFTGKGPYGRFDYDGPAWMVTTLATGDKLAAAEELVKFHCHDYQFLVERSHTVGMILVTEPHPDYESMFAQVAAKDSPTQEERREQSLAVLARQFDGGMVFPGEVAAPFDDMWGKMSDAILINKKPIKQVLGDYQKQYDEMLSKTHFWITPEA
jgi:ABC-type glycerol-3-phosphate transport system substrate-binding protein